MMNCVTYLARDLLFMPSTCLSEEQHVLSIIYLRTLVSILRHLHAASNKVGIHFAALIKRIIKHPQMERNGGFNAV